MISDSIRGGQLIENLGPEPIRVYSESERRRVMKERGLVDAVRHTQGSRLTSNWSSVSPSTIESLQMTVTERPDGFSVPPDGEPHAD